MPAGPSMTGMALPQEKEPLSTGGFRSLDATKIVETARALQQRVDERFPGSSLGRVASEMVRTTEGMAKRVGLLAQPVGWLRGLAALGVLGLVAVFGATLWVFTSKAALFSSVADFLQGLDAGINELVFLGVAVFFLLSIENRLKRRWALASLHVLRSMAHIIDMHQLTKDPDRLVRRGPDTPSSPHRTMSAFELTRYLDYCTEMLAILSKLAALHVQSFNDPVTLSAVNDIENLTSDLSRKIWQKIMILDRVAGRDEGREMREAGGTG